MNDGFRVNRPMDAVDFQMAYERSGENNQDVFRFVNDYLHERGDDGLGTGDVFAQWINEGLSSFSGDKGLDPACVVFKSIRVFPEGLPVNGTKRGAFEEVSAPVENPPAISVCYSLCGMNQEERVVERGAVGLFSFKKEEGAIVMLDHKGAVKQKWLPERPFHAPEPTSCRRRCRTKKSTDLELG